MRKATDDIDYKKLVQLLTELIELQRDEEALEVMALYVAGMPISTLDHGRAQKVHGLMHKLSALTGQTFEELFDEGGLQRIIKDYCCTVLSKRLIKQG